MRGPKIASLGAIHLPQVFVQWNDSFILSSCQCKGDAALRMNITTRDYSLTVNEGLASKKTVVLCQ